MLSHHKNFTFRPVNVVGSRKIEIIDRRGFRYIVFIVAYKDKYLGRDTWDYVTHEHSYELTYDQYTQMLLKLGKPYRVYKDQNFISHTWSRD